MSTATKSTGFDIEGLVGYILLVGVLLSVVLILISVIWRFVNTGSFELEYTIAGMNLFEFVHSSVQQVIAGTLRPRLLSNLGIAVLMLTPYVRVLASMVYFAVAARNLKYTVFTGFVFVVLTYSLFLR